FSRVITSGHTVATANTLVLVNADVIGSFKAEVDVQGHPVELLAQVTCGLLQRAELGETGIILGVRNGLQHLLGLLITSVKRCGSIAPGRAVCWPRVPKFARPARIVEDAGFGTQSYVRVYQ